MIECATVKEPAWQERPWAPWPGWLVANGVGSLLGWLAFIATSGLHMRGHPDELLRAFIVALCTATLSGTILGAAQRAVLRPSIPALAWVIATAVGMGLALFLIIVLWSQLEAQPPGSAAARFLTVRVGEGVVAGGIYGLALGLCQWLVVRRRGLVAWSWLAASTGGYALGQALATVVGGAIPGPDTQGDVRSMVVNPTLIGLLYGLATALALRRSEPVDAAERAGNVTVDGNVERGVPHPP